MERLRLVGLSVFAGAGVPACQVSPTGRSVALGALRKSVGWEGARRGLVHRVSSDLLLSYPSFICDRRPLICGSCVLVAMDRERAGITFRLRLIRRKRPMATSFFLS